MARQTLHISDDVVKILITDAWHIDLKSVDQIGIAYRDGVRFARVRIRQDHGIITLRRGRKPARAHRDVGGDALTGNRMECRDFTDWNAAFLRSRDDGRSKRMLRIMLGGGGQRQQPFRIVTPFAERQHISE